MKWSTPKAYQNTRRLFERGVKERPAATVTERRRFLEGFTGINLSDPTVRRLLNGSSKRKRKAGHPAPALLL